MFSAYLSQEHVCHRYFIVYSQLLQMYDYQLRYLCFESAYKKEPFRQYNYLDKADNLFHALPKLPLYTRCIISPYQALKFCDSQGTQELLHWYLRIEMLVRTMLVCFSEPSIYKRKNPQKSPCYKKQVNLCKQCRASQNRETWRMTVAIHIEEIASAKFCETYCAR